MLRILPALSLLVFTEILTRLVLLLPLFYGSDSISPLPRSHGREHAIFSITDEGKNCLLCEDGEQLLYQ